MLTNHELATWSRTRRMLLIEHANELRMKAAKLIEDADRIDAASQRPVTYEIPVNQNEATE